ncbi:MAG: DUF192 domain-containing protein [Candidatus Caldarchaeum sp.]|nr:DUF192 domain-containing protein [Candidatus Caldarchaeum sp.]MDW8360399.1 DUF192 domain-containing protein [Candidatus Caldarchaeum sp.]
MIQLRMEDGHSKHQSITSTTTEPPQHPYVVVEGVRVYVEIADTVEERSKGLSDRDHLEDGWGMLFVFEKPGRYSFWMYRMRFALDIIWVGADGRVVHVVEDAQPCPLGGVCPSLEPADEALYVVEVRSGFVRENGVKLGSRVEVFLAPSPPSPTSQAR